MNADKRTNELSAFIGVYLWLKCPFHTFPGSWYSECHCIGRRTAHRQRLRNQAPSNMLAGTDGDLWIGTLQNGVFHYAGG